MRYTGTPGGSSKVEPDRGELRFGPEIFKTVNEDQTSLVVGDVRQNRKAAVPMNRRFTDFGTLE